MDLFDRFVAQLGVVQAAWMPFALAVIIAALIVWKIVVWRYSGTIETLEHRLQLRDDQIANFQRTASAADLEPFTSKAEPPAITMAVPPKAASPIQQTKSKKRSEQQTRDRALVGNKVTPKFLMALCRGNTAIQAQKAVEIYIGKWMEVQGTVTDVMRLHSTISVALGVPITLENLDNPEILSTVWMDFRGDAEHLEALQQGDSLTAIGKIAEVKGYALTLKECEFVNLG